ncbi:MAG: YdeI/OmpD-associated family protein [Bacteroidota bacterium]|nr:YdeI/OmpD-associated family protein [Bacteroidota bacterium]
MVSFTTPLRKFADRGEKSGWTYIGISEEIASQIKPNTKKSFRVKGKLDNYTFKGMALLPMGDGGFILAMNGEVRSNIGRRQGDMINVQMEVDNSPIIYDQDFMECLATEENGLKFFNTLAKSHQHYFSKWIASAKTDETKAKRIMRAINALNRNMGYSEMLREKI